MSVIMDLWHSIVGIITTSGWITLVIIAVIAIGAAFMIEGAGSLVSATVGALIVFGLATTIYTAATAKGGANWSGMPQADWAALHSVTVPILLAYAIIFAVAIGVLNFIRSIVLR
ncbi:MAG: hypothetical protein ABSA49_10085 [Rhizomicrobium sp.]|jgi:hypothetical protein